MPGRSCRWRALCATVAVSCFFRLAFTGALYRVRQAGYAAAIPAGPIVQTRIAQPLTADEPFRRTQSHDVPADLRHSCELHFLQTIGIDAGVAAAQAKRPLAPSQPRRRSARGMRESMIRMFIEGLRCWIR